MGLMVKSEEKYDLTDRTELLKFQAVEGPNTANLWIKIE
jgi:hypothetical protein